MKRKNILTKVYRAATLATVIFGLVLIFTPEPASGGRLFLLTYFTVQSNILVGLFLSAELLAGKVLHPSLHGAVTLYIIITGVVFNTMLAPLIEAEGLSLISMQITHTAVPLLFLGDYLVNRSCGLISFRHLKFWLVYPVLYLVESSIEGLITGFFRYPFLDFMNNSPAVYITGLAAVTAGFIGFGSLLIFIDRRGSAKRTGAAAQTGS